MTNLLKALILSGLIMLVGIIGFAWYVTANTERSSTIDAMDAKCHSKGGIPLATLSGRVCFARSAIIEVTP